MKNRSALIHLFCVNLWLSISVAAQAPEILKVDPPSWWIRSTVNPVRLMIHGRNLQGARVDIQGLRIINTPKINDRGTYIFVDVFIAPNAPSGSRSIRVTTPRGSAKSSFEVLAPLNRAGRFQGFSPNDVMYLIMIDRFADGDPSNNDPPQSRGLYDRNNKFYYHGGDLQGVINHLPYLKELGVTAIWLTPWYDNYDHLNEIELKEDKPSTGFHGYNPQDFFAVEEHFGTHAKLRELVETAHRSGIKIIQDQVVNHTGPYHPWVDDPPRPTWFNGTKSDHLKNVFQTWVLHDPRAVQSLKDATMKGWFLDFLPDLNQDDTEVSRYLIQNTLWWIGTTGLDGIRMDTWQYVPNSFWYKWRWAIQQEFPGFRVVGEVKDGDVVHTSFFQVSDRYSLLDFPLFYSIRHAFAERKNIDEIPKTLAKDYLYKKSEILVTLLGGHDDGRFMSEKGATIEGLKLANAFLLTTRGVPQLYYGDELALEGGDEPTTRGDFPGGFAGDERDAFTVGGRTKEQQELFEYIKRLTTLRREYEVLRTGELVNLYVSEQQYAYARQGRSGTVIVAINNDNDAATMEFDVSRLALTGALKDQLGVSQPIQIEGGKMRVSLPKRSAAMFTR